MWWSGLSPHESKLAEAQLRATAEGRRSLAFGEYVPDLDYPRGVGTREWQAAVKRKGGILTPAELAAVWQSILDRDARERGWKRAPKAREHVKKRSNAEVQAARASRGGSYCSICKGPHVYKHGRA